MQKGRRFLYNAVLLAVVNIALRLIGVSFNTFVSAKVGAEGMGLLTLVMSVYGLSVTLAASGVNLAAVRLTARALTESEGENFAHGSARLRRVMGGCVLYSLIFGIATAILLFALSPLIGTHVLGDSRTVPSLRVLALSLPAISLSSALAGYFTGVRRVYKNAIVSIAEQFVKVTLTACILLLFAPAGIEYACLAVVGGGAVAEGGSLLLSWLLYIRDGLRRKKGKPILLPPAFAQVFHTAFPVAVGAYARQGLVSAEHLAIPWGFRKNGASAAEALASYGTLHGMVYPLVFFPSAVLSAFAGLLVPEFAEYHARGDRAAIRSVAARVMRLSLLFSIGVSGIFISFAYEIGSRLYPGTDAAALLARIAPLIPVMYLDTAVDSILKGLGEQVYCMRVNIIDSLCCLLLVVTLLPRFGLEGYFFVQYLCELLNATLSIGRLLEVTDLRPQVGVWVFHPLLSVIAATSAVRFLSAIPAMPLIGAGGSPTARLAAAILLYCLCAFTPVWRGKRKTHPV